jgi:hypothetical protein
LFTLEHYVLKQTYVQYRQMFEEEEMEQARRRSFPRRRDRGCRCTTHWRRSVATGSAARRSGSRDPSGPPRDAGCGTGFESVARQEPGDRRASTLMAGRLRARAGGARQSGCAVRSGLLGTRCRIRTAARSRCLPSGPRPGRRS